MSRVDEIVKEARAAAFEIGIPKMAADTGINEDTLRRLLGNAPPQAIQNLKALDAYVSSRPRVTP